MLDHSLNRSGSQSQQFCLPQASAVSLLLSIPAGSQDPQSLGPAGMAFLQGKFQAVVTVVCILGGI